jgi:hypothetical protein
MIGTPDDSPIERKYIGVPLTFLIICETHTLSSYLSIRKKKKFSPNQVHFGCIFSTVKHFCLFVCLKGGIFEGMQFVFVSALAIFLAKSFFFTSAFVYKHIISRGH